MFDNNNSSNSSKVPKIQKSKSYANCHIKIMEVMKKDSLLGARTENYADYTTSTDTIKELRT